MALEAPEHPMRALASVCRPACEEHVAPVLAIAVRSMKTRHPVEIALLALIAVALAAGVVGARLDLAWYERRYAAENGPIELGTAIAFLVAAGAALSRLRPRDGSLRPLHALTWAGLAALGLFAAGEELSWGQHLFRWSSSEFFVAHNAQRETNLHNLVVSGVKVNKLVFSQLLSVCAALYLVVLPLLHRARPRFARLVDGAGVPVPKALHAVALATAFVAIALVPSRLRHELLELAAAVVFLLVSLFPRNAAAIRPAGGGEPAAQRAPGAVR